MTCQPTVPFANQLCTLANITHVRDYFPTVARKSLPDQEKHLRLLDAIALLLVTEAKSDVAAVMFEQTAHEVIFYYSKNRPSTSLERQYLEQVRQIALTVPDINECAMQLLDRVIPMCRKKIVSRLQRLSRCIVRSELVVSDDTSGTFRSHLVERMPHLFPETGGLSCKHIVLSYLSQVHSIDHAKCSEITLRKLIRFAFAIGSYKPFGDLIHNETVVSRLRKIGNYFGATMGIAKTVSRLQQQNRGRYTTDNVTFLEVQPPTQTTTYISTDHTATLNLFGATCGLAPITRDALKAVYPSACTWEETKQAHQRVTHSVHAECTLAMHALALRKDWAYVEIGVSKGSCWMCEKFLAHIRTRGLQFLVTGFHGKLQPGWMCPPNASPQDSDAVAARVGDALKEIIEHVLNRRRSDSFPHADSDGESKGVGRVGYDDDDLQWMLNARVKGV